VRVHCRAVSDVFEESFFPVHNESFHGMFGMINLHGIPKPTWRAYQLLHETGDVRLPVKAPTKPTPPQPKGSCSALVEGMDVWGGDVAGTVEPCPTCGLFSMADCCDLCLRSNKQGLVCDTADLWHQPGEVRGYKCGLKQFKKKLNLTKNSGRSYVRVTREPSPPPTNAEVCATNTGVLAVQNGTAHVDLLVYNHAAFGAPIVDCNVNVSLAALELKAGGLASATVRRIDEAHSNPLAAWIAMGAPDYTTAEQNAQLLVSSALVVEKLANIATVGAYTFEIKVPPHGVAAVRVVL
jgi:hypothetical protein